MPRRLRNLLLALAAVAATSLVALVWAGSSRIGSPPWYQMRSPELGLRPMAGDPWGEDGWQGIHRDPQSDLGVAFEDVSFPAVDGSTLRGWLVPGTPQAEVAIATVHGAGSDRRDFLRHLPVFHDLGYPVLLFDCREHGISDGEARGISYGVREHRDVTSAVRYLKEDRGYGRVAVVGTSQGGASVLLAAARDPAIDAVVAENPFTTLRELMRHALRDQPPPSDWLLEAVIVTHLLRTGGRGLPSPLEAVAAIRQPLYLMHGTADRVIPYQHSERLHAAAPGSQLWLAEGAVHAALYNRYPEEWTRRVRGFLAGTVGLPR